MKNQTTLEPSKTFEDLIVWQKSRELASHVYKLTKNYPSEERYNLVPQMRRAAVSASSNIAEGFSRHRAKDKEHFYVMAAGSLSELLNHLVISSDLGYISVVGFDESRQMVTTAQRYLLALLKAHRR